MAIGQNSRPVDSFEPFSRLPAVFGRFLLLKRLSRGGMGEIFLAKIGEIEGFEKLVIIKKILPSLIENLDFIARFVDEAQVAIKLNHANIAAVYEVGRVEGEYFLALEYVEGRDLRCLIQRCRERQIRLPVDLCLYLCRELTAGLAYAHRRTNERGQPLSLVHCDISPPNLMVSFEGEVKVIDFGIARSALRTAGSNPNMGFGKFGYMAPEQLLRGGVIDRRTDIYAAGVVLYELLSGDRLYQFPEGADYRQIARTVCQGKFAPPSHRDPSLDPSLDALVCRALASHKEDRYQFAEEFRDALQHHLYQLNPSITADSLALVMSEMFGDEWERERQELAEMRSVDVEAFRNEMQGSANHTVTFARAAISLPSIPAISATQSTGAALPVVSPIPSASNVISSTDAFVHSSSHHRSWRNMLISGGLVVLVALLLIIKLGQRTEPSGYAVSISPALHPQPAPIVVPLNDAKKSQPSPQGAPALARPKQIRHKKQIEPTVPDPGPTPQSVEAKFKEIRGEYNTFRKNFGGRLEDHWQQLLQEAAMGRRDQHMDDMLEQLRREMHRIKSGG